jgi:hypothetical protein
VKILKISYKIFLLILRLIKVILLISKHAYIHVQFIFSIADSDISARESVPDVSEPTPDISMPVPVVSESAPDIFMPVPVVSEPTPDITVPVPVVSEPTPDITVPVPVVSEPTPDISVPVPVVSESAPDISVNVTESVAASSKPESAISVPLADEITDHIEIIDSETQSNPSATQKIVKAMQGIADSIHKECTQEKFTISMEKNVLYFYCNIC